jgi:RHS repeat-associated protein
LPKSSPRDCTQPTRCDPGRVHPAMTTFTGKKQDEATGTYDFPAREYPPIQSRWWTPDPAGLGAVDPTAPASWNRYAYSSNTPLEAVDPSGMDDAWPFPCMPVSQLDTNKTNSAQASGDNFGPDDAAAEAQDVGVDSCDPCPLAAYGLLCPGGGGFPWGGPGVAPYGPGSPPEAAPGAPASAAPPGLPGGWPGYPSANSNGFGGPPIWAVGGPIIVPPKWAIALALWLADQPWAAIYKNAAHAPPQKMALSRNL